ncbi:MAG: MBL fold metallo-hydrolase [Ruminococcus sp.]|nr:MBL fold metallo-hydrolase [Ruminococcus sp.]
MLMFLGRGSAFTNAHNCAYFVNNNDLILLDCPASAFENIKKLHLEKFHHIYILVTHTHGDHIGGVGTMLQYAYFVLQNPLTVVAPSRAVLEDLSLLLYQIEGCEKNWFYLITADNLEKSWLMCAIPTQHVEPLKNKCFGYALYVNHHKIIYTGDTATLMPYVPYLQQGTILYTECSVFQSNVHLYLPDILPILTAFTEKDIQVYLMHLDDEKQISSMIEHTKIQLAPLSESY